MNTNNSNTSLRGAQRRSNLQSSISQSLLLLILILAFSLRMYQASTTLMWGDEGFSVYSASRDLYAITFEGKDVDPHPPLYYYLLHFWMPLAGTSELALRFFSIFFGTATVAIVYALGRKLFSRRVGLLSAAFYALTPFAVQYSQEVRMYALVMFLGALTTYLFVRWSFPALSKAGESQGGGKFSLSMLLTQYSLYQSAFLLSAQGIFLLPFLKSKFKFILQWLALAIAIVLLFLPWLLAHSDSAIKDVQGVAGDTKPYSLFEFLARGLSAISVGPTLPLATQYNLAAIFAAILLGGIALAFATRTAQRNDWLLVVHMAMPMLMYYPVYLLAPLYRGRLFALALVPLVILLARMVALVASRVKLASVALAIFILGSSIFSLQSYFFSYSRYQPTVDDYIPAIRAIEQRAQPGDVILFHAYWQIGYFLSHYRGAPVEYRSLEKSGDVDYATAKSRNVWAIVQGLPLHGGEGTLYGTAYIVREENYGQMRVLYYRVNDAMRAEKFAEPIIFDNGIALMGYRLNSEPLKPGGVVTLELDWRAEEKIAQEYTVSMRLMRGNEILAQADTPPLNGSLPMTQWTPRQVIADRRGLIAPENIPQGEYEVRVVLYQFDSKKIAQIVAPQNVRGAAVPLGRVTIAK